MNRVLFDTNVKIGQEKLKEIQIMNARLAQTKDFEAYEQGLKRLGIYPGDRLYERLIGRIATAIGGSKLQNIFNPK